MENPKELTDEQLLEALANATKTQYACGGHTKAARNENHCEQYKKELTNRGIEIPVASELLAKGTFNGFGAS